MQIIKHMIKITDFTLVNLKCSSLYKIVDWNKKKYLLIDVRFFVKLIIPTVTYYVFRGTKSKTILCLCIIGKHILASHSSVDVEM